MAPSDFGVLENVKAITTNYAIHAKVIKHHNIAVIVNIKMSTISYNTGIKSLSKLFHSSVYHILSLDCHLQHFLEFGNIFGFGRYL